MALLDRRVGADPRADAPARPDPARAAAHILGYIRHAAHVWTEPQHQCLRCTTAQTKANGIVDREALDAPDQLFKRKGGGFERLNNIFNGELETVLGQFNEAIWAKAA